MKINTPNLGKDLKEFNKKERESNRVVRATVLEINDDILRVSTHYDTGLTKNTLIEVDRLPSKILKKEKKILLIRILAKTVFRINQEISIKNVQKEIIIGKLEEITDDIENNNLSKENIETLDVLMNKQTISFSNKKYKISPKLNRNQRLAVERVLQADKFHMIQGPPGSGKTHTIVEIIKQLHLSPGKILITTHTHVALDNIVERLDLFDDGDIVRIGPKDKISNGALKYSLDEQTRRHPDYRKIRDKKRRITKLEKNESYEGMITTPVKENIFTKLFGRIFNFKENENPTNNFNAKSADFNNIDEINEIKKEMDEIRNNIQHDIVDGAKIIASTVLSSSGFLTKGIAFDYVIMDEASQVPVYLGLIPLLKTRKFALIGDNKQLQPIKNGNASYLLNKSIFNLLIEKYPENYTFLNIQYRMNERISDIASRLYYDNRLLTGSSARNRRITLENDRYFLLNDDVITVLDTSDTDFHESNVSGGCLNEFEANLILHLCRALTFNGISSGDIGVITPYRRQKNYIGNMLEKEGLNVECDTIYRFQGREKDVIIISFCKSSYRSLSIFQKRFLGDENQLNVSITRARRKLIIVGDFSMLCGAENIKKLVESIGPCDVTYLSDFL